MVRDTGAELWAIPMGIERRSMVRDTGAELSFLPPMCGALIGPQRRSMVRDTGAELWAIPTGVRDALNHTTWLPDEDEVEEVEHVEEALEI